MIKKFEEFINESLGKRVEEVAELINSFCNPDGDEFGGKNILYIQADVTGLDEFLNDDVVMFFGQKVMDADRLCNAFKENADKNIVLNDIDAIGIVRDSKSLNIIKCAGELNPEDRVIVCGEKFTFTGKLVIISATGKDELIRLGGGGISLASRCYFA